MDEDTAFKVAAVALLVLMKLARWSSRHLIGFKASWPAMRKNPIDTTLLMFCALVWLVSIVLYLCFPQQISAYGVGLPVWLRSAGVALGLLAVLLLGWGDRCLGNNLSVTLQIKDDHTLVTEGPYRWIRHPLYAAALLFSVALLLISANWFVGVCFFGGMGIVCGYRIPREERMMIRHFGDGYREYMTRTGCLLPRIIRRAGTTLATDNAERSQTQPTSRCERTQQETDP